MDKNKSIRRASLRERLHFLRTGRIPNYWARASQDVFLTFINMLSADTAAADSFFAGRSKEERKAVLDFLFTARMPYSKVKKYLHRIHDGEFSPTDTIGSDGNRPDYFPKPSEPLKQCPRIGIPGPTMKIYSTPSAMEKHLVIQNQQAINK